MPTVSPSCHDSSEALVQPGEVLVGKYLVERVIGAGAMGQVVAAIHLQLKERVAIKLLRPEASQSFNDAQARFLREARAAVRIKSQHVARVIDVGLIESGVPAMVMEYLEGSDLKSLLGEQGPLPMAAAVDYLLQACEAIAEAHALGIVHRDLKPANLFFTRKADGSPCIKVLDFGISKVSLVDPSASDAAMAKTNVTMGSPVYMSPEQLRSTADVDARTDLWSLGVTLYELLTGTWPFSAPTMPQMCAKILEAQPPSIRRLRPDLPPELDGVIRRCLEVDLRRRYRDIAELASALAPFGSAAARLSAECVARVVRNPRSGSSPGLTPLPSVPAVVRGEAATLELATARHAPQLATIRVASDPARGDSTGAGSTGATFPGLMSAGAGTTGASAWGATSKGVPSRRWTRVLLGAGLCLGLGAIASIGLVIWKARGAAPLPVSTASQAAAMSQAAAQSSASPGLEGPAGPAGAGALTALPAVAAVTKGPPSGRQSQAAAARSATAPIASARASASASASAAAKAAAAAPDVPPPPKVMESAPPLSEPPPPPPAKDPYDQH